MDKYINSLDTFYFYYTNKIDYDTYVSKVDMIVSSSLDSFGWSNGRSWFDFEYFRIGVMSYETTLSSNNYPFLIQLKFDAVKKIDLTNPISSLEYLVKSLPIADLDLSNYLISRIDYNITFSSSSFKLFPDFISPFRSKSIFYGKNNDIETVYLGKRNNGLVFRAYNKSLEMFSKDNFSKIDYYSNIFTSVENLFTFEIESSRKFLSRFNFDNNLSLLDIASVISILHDYITNIKMFDINLDSNYKNYNSKNYDLLTFALSPFDFKDISIRSVNVERKYFNSKPSLEYLISSIDKKINSYFSSIDTTLTKSEIIDILFTRIDYIDNDETIVGYLDNDTTKEIERIFKNE